jgi:hypothetical protein
MTTQRFVKRRCDMNRFTRMLTMAGLGLATTVSLGAGQAVASTSTEQGAAQAQVSADPWFGGDRVVGYYRSWNMCDRAGEFGEDEGWWDDYQCVRVRSGSHSRRFALVVDYDDWGHGYVGHWPGSWNGQWTPGQWNGPWGGGLGNNHPWGGNNNHPWDGNGNGNGNGDGDNHPWPHPTRTMPTPIPTSTSTAAVSFNSPF